jgi:flagellar hook-length control protein FliK
MATDMQPSLSGILNAANHAIPEKRDRNAALPSSSSDNRFDSIFGTAQARRTGLGHEAVPVRARQAANGKPEGHSRTDSQAERTTKSSTTTRREETSTSAAQSEIDRADKHEEGEDEQNSTSRDKSRLSGDVSPDMLLAVGLTSQPVATEKVAAPTPSSSTEATDTIEATTEVTAPAQVSAPILSVSASNNGSSVTTAPTASTAFPDQISGETPETAQAKIAIAPPARSSEASVAPAALDGDSGNPNDARMAELEKQNATGTIATALPDGAPKDSQGDQDKAKMAVTVLAVDTLRNVTPSLEAGDQSGAVMQASGAAVGKATSSGEQYLGQNASSSSESREGPDHSKSNLVSPEENTLRPQFLDPSTGMSPSAPSAGDSRIGRGEGGPTAVSHVAETERLNELRGNSFLTQSVTVDLDPLDMGPLRVRVMMTDQTVHAHIRTEHGELGQSLLQQGQSLDSSLRTTGLEMGMLRVTVDQQQQGRGEGAWAFHQQQGRPGPASGALPASEEDRALRIEHGGYNNGRVSFFA